VTSCDVVCGVLKELAVGLLNNNIEIDSRVFRGHTFCRTVSLHTSALYCLSFPTIHKQASTLLIAENALAVLTSLFIQICASWYRFISTQTTLEHCTYIFVQCVLKVAVNLGYGRVRLKCDGTRWRTGGEVWNVAVHLWKVLEVTWCPRASVQAWTGLILLSSALYRSLSERPLCYCIVSAVPFSDTHQVKKTTS